MEFSLKGQTLFRRVIAIPQDHGSWVFLLSPLLIGLFAGGHFSLASGYLILASLAVFLIRQPVTIAVKAYSGRRSRRDLPAAYFWMAVYAITGLFALAGLLRAGFGYLLYLAFPGILVFVWHLFLVSRRAERKQMGIEMVASGGLALSAPAGLWIGLGRPDPLGWWLFVLTWFQSSASIVYAYLRLEQRRLVAAPAWRERLRMGRRALIYATFNSVAVLSFSISGLLPSLLVIPYSLQWFETVYGVARPAIRKKPTEIGIRQLIISAIFTFLFVLTWNS
jgi:hypothetical protein